jgi:hypothetical protein
MHGDFGWKCRGTAKAVCCERNFGSGVFCALASKAQQSIHRLKPSVFTRAKGDPEGIGHVDIYALRSFDDSLSR